MSFFEKLYSVSNIFFEIGSIILGVMIEILFQLLKFAVFVRKNVRN